jgi:hypothetical protein
MLIIYIYSYLVLFLVDLDLSKHVICQFFHFYLRDFDELEIQYNFWINFLDFMSLLKFFLIVFLIFLEEFIHIYLYLQIIIFFFNQLSLFYHELDFKSLFTTILIFFHQQFCDQWIFLLVLLFFLVYLRRQLIYSP